MTDFTDLCQLHNPPVRWVITLEGTRISDGAALKWYCLKGENVRHVVDGVVEHFRDVWMKGSEIDQPRVITRADTNASRSFFGSGSPVEGEKTWQFRPDALMRAELAGARLDGKIQLWGWGANKADGSAFDFSDADLRMDGQMTARKTLEGGHVVQVAFVVDEFDFDSPYQRDRFGGFDVTQDGFTPATGGDQVGRWLHATTAAFDLDGAAPLFPGFTVELIGIVNDLSPPQVNADGILVHSGPPDNIPACSWGLLMAPLAVVTMVAKAERFPTSFVMPLSGWFSLVMSIKPDGVTVEVSAGTGRAPNSVFSVGSFVLGDPVSPPSAGVSQLNIGSPFLDPSFLTSGAPWSVSWAEVRTHDRAMDLDEINLRRAETWVPTETVRPSHLYRFSGVADGVAFDEDGGVDLLALAEILIPSRSPSGDGPLRDAFDNDTVGRTMDLVFGEVDNKPAIDTGIRFDDKYFTPHITEVYQARAAEEPFTTDRVIEALMDTDKDDESITISNVIGQELINFFDFLQPDPPLFPVPDPDLGAQLNGQVIEATIQGPPLLDSEFTISRITPDGKTIFIQPPGNINNNRTNEDGIVKTPTTGSFKFSAAVVNDRGIIEVDRGSLINPGQVTARISGYQGPTPANAQSLSGLFTVALSERFDYSGTITVEASFLDISPSGKSLPLGGSDSTRKFLNELVVPNWWMYEPVDDSFRLGGWELPGDPVREITESEHQGIAEILRSRTLNFIELLFAKNDMPQDKSSAIGNIPQANLDRWAKPGQTVTRANPSPDPRGIDPDGPIVTAIYDREGAEQAVEVMGDLVFSALLWPKWTTINLKAIDVKVGETVRVFSLDPLLMWQGGQNTTVTSMIPSTDNMIDFEGFARADSETLMENGVPLLDNDGSYIHE